MVLTSGPSRGPLETGFKVLNQRRFESRHQIADAITGLGQVFRALGERRFERLNLALLFRQALLEELDTVLDTETGGENG